MNGFMSRFGQSQARVRLVVAILLCFSVFECRPGFADDKKLPVILLTGFEPFGERRPPNPSWEGIAALNDTEWNGHRLVAMQLPVIWGEPIQQIGIQVDQWKPVAVFSFGQGASGAFAIETRARNQRGEIADNSGSLPQLPLIVGDGPTEYTSEFPADKVIGLLTQKGYSVRRSEDAGQYLCEETLYSLESLRRSRKIPSVAFCHVPPLGSMMGDRVVDADYVQKFVVDYLAAWQTVNAPAASQSTEQTARANSTGRATDPREAEVNTLIREYFKSWSEQRMRDYGNCFAEDAVIQEVASSGRLHTQMKDPFVATQTTYHKMAVFKAVEVPVKTTISFEADLARAVVYWKLTAGPRLQYGYDHFTLVRDGSKWKIAHLIFYGVRNPED